MKNLKLAALLLALAVYIFWVVQAQREPIQNDIASRANAALEKEGMPWARATVDGRYITVAGLAPSEALRSRAAAVVDVDGEHSITNAVTVSAAPQAAATPPAAPEVVPSAVPNEAPAALSAAPSASAAVSASAAPPPTEEEQAADACQIAFDKLLTESKINFAVARATIQPDSYGLLKRLAKVAKGCPDARIRIEGHTDSTGKAKLNKELSQKRAKAVVVHLLGLGIARKRLTASGLGPAKPIADNDTADGRARNRRIEFKIDRTTSQSQP